MVLLHITTEKPALNSNEDDVDCRIWKIQLLFKKTSHIRRG